MERQSNKVAESSRKSGKCVFVILIRLKHKVGDGELMRVAGGGQDKKCSWVMEVKR